MSSAVAIAATPAPAPSGRIEQTRADRKADDRFARLIDDTSDAPGSRAPIVSERPSPRSQAPPPTPADKTHAAAGPAAADAPPPPAKSASSPAPTSPKAEKLAVSDDASIKGTGSRGDEQSATPSATADKAASPALPIVVAPAVLAAPPPTTKGAQATSGTPTVAAPVSGAAGAIVGPLTAPTPTAPQPIADGRTNTDAPLPAPPPPLATTTPAAVAQAVDTARPASSLSTRTSRPDSAKTAPTRGPARAALSPDKGSVAFVVPSASPAAVAPALSGASILAAQAAQGEATAAEGDSAPLADADAPQGSAAATSAPASALAPIDTTTAPAAPSPSSTVSAFASQIVKRLDQRTSRFDVTLDPAGLGRVSVALEIGGDGALTARLAFERADAAHMLGAHMQDLHQALADAGFRLSADAIRFDVAPQLGPTITGGAAGGFGGSQTFTDGGGQAPSSHAARSFAAADDGDPLSAAAYASQAAAGGLDIRI